MNTRFQKSANLRRTLLKGQRFGFKENAEFKRQHSATNPQAKDRNKNSQE